MAFLKFPELPTELRQKIWRLCLPHRIVELEMPDDEVFMGNPENSGGCLLSPTSRVNSRPPAITRVCHESRMVALEHGGLLVDDDQIKSELRDVSPFGLSMAPVVWVDRRRNVVHLNWWGIYDADYNRCMDPVPLWLAAADRSQGASLTAPLFEVDLKDGPYDSLVRDRTLLVCLRIVSIHAPLQPAVESGLFGLLGEERVTLVDAADTERKEQYRAFWEKHGRRPDLNPYRFFDKWCQQNEWAQEKVEGLELMWLLSRWFKVKSSVPSAATVWKKQPSDSDDETWPARLEFMEPMEIMKYWTPNRKHPWVRDTHTSLPKIRPTVMFRLCTHEQDEDLVGRKALTISWSLQSDLGTSVTAPVGQSHQLSHAL
ncbi:hypothetical protein QBC46DRAFT_411070 [Diplogelasinospora grovesii]|uniref:2EXR domain-containing protein n=1 Tax=Diplogelasinospora grovesii TaxID=303347 RepID=A0AAN6N4Z7_9PEZI|nr:hypothetical protein QBC46DRAFT_411070 [Diplogelasinospora grovesii]